MNTGTAGRGSKSPRNPKRDASDTVFGTAAWIRSGLRETYPWSPWAYQGQKGSMWSEREARRRPKLPRLPRVSSGAAELRITQPSLVVMHLPVPDE
jgi:hypothetical protein